MTRAKSRAKKKAQQQLSEPVIGVAAAHTTTTPNGHLNINIPATTAETTASSDKKMVPISDKALAMLNQMLGNRGMMQRDPSTGAIDVVLNTELFPNLTLPFPALEVPNRSSGDPEADIRSVLQEVAGGALSGMHQSGEHGAKGGGQQKLPNLEDLLKLPIFESAGGNGDSIPSLAKHLFPPHPSSSAPYHSTAAAAHHQQLPTGSSSQLKSTATIAANGKQPMGSSSSNVAHHHTCPHCDQVHSPEPSFTDDDFDEDEEFSFYGSEESFEYDNAEEEEEDIDDVGSHLSHYPEDSSAQEVDLEDGDETEHSMGEIEDELDLSGLPDKEDEREEAREFFSRVFGKGKERERSDAQYPMSEPYTSSSGGGPAIAATGAGGTAPSATNLNMGHHVCGPDCQEASQLRLSEARLQKEIFFEKMKVAFMYDGWPEDLLKKKWSELSDQEREYIRRTVLARATDGPICEDEKSRARLLRKGWPPSALNKRWSQLDDTERKKILQVETGRNSTDTTNLRVDLGDDAEWTDADEQQVPDPPRAPHHDRPTTRVGGGGKQRQQQQSGHDEAVDDSTQGSTRKSSQKPIPGSRTSPPTATVTPATATKPGPDNNEQEEPYMVDLGGDLGLVDLDNLTHSPAIKEAIKLHRPFDPESPYYKIYGAQLAELARNVGINRSGRLDRGDGNGGDSGRGDVVNPTVQSASSAINATADSLLNPGIGGIDQAVGLDEPTKAEVRKKLTKFHAKATETAKWIMSHLETSSGIDPYLRGSLEEAKQVFEDFRTNFKVPDFLQDHMNVAEVMYEDLNGHPVPHPPGGQYLDAQQQRASVENAADHVTNPLTAAVMAAAVDQANQHPTAASGEQKKKKKKQKKKKKRKSEAGIDHAELADGESTILDDPERLDWACNELFMWIKAVLWTIEQDAIRAARQMIDKKETAAHIKSGKKGPAISDSQTIQVTWAGPERAKDGTPQIKGTGKGGVEAIPGMTWTPKRAPDAEKMRAMMRSVGVEVDPA